MADHHSGLRELAAEHLRGEGILSTLNVVYGGKVNLNQAPTGLAALGHPDDKVAAGEELAARIEQGSEVTFPSVRQMALVLTPSRVLIWGRGGLKGKPKDFLAELPVAAFASASHESTASGSRLMVKITSGWEVNLEAGRSEPASEFAVQLEALVAGEDPGAALALLKAPPEPPGD